MKTTQEVLNFTTTLISQGTAMRDEDVRVLASCKHPAARLFLLATQEHKLQPSSFVFELLKVPILPTTSTDEDFLLRFKGKADFLTDNSQQPGVRMNYITEALKLQCPLTLLFALFSLVLEGQGNFNKEKFIGNFIGACCAYADLTSEPTFDPSKN